MSGSTPEITATTPCPCENVLNTTIAPFNPTIKYSLPTISSFLDPTIGNEGALVLWTVGSLLLLVLGLQQFIGAGIAAFAGPNSAFGALGNVPNIPGENDDEDNGGQETGTAQFNANFPPPPNPPAPGPVTNPAVVQPADGGGTGTDGDSGTNSGTDATADGTGTAAAGVSETGPTGGATTTEGDSGTDSGTATLTGGVGTDPGMDAGVPTGTGTVPDPFTDPEAALGPANGTQTRLLQGTRTESSTDTPRPSATPLTFSNSFSNGRNPVPATLQNGLTRPLPSSQSGAAAAAVEARPFAGTGAGRDPASGGLGGPERPGPTTGNVNNGARPAAPGFVAEADPAITFQTRPTQSAATDAGSPILPERGPRPNQSNPQEPGLRAPSGTGAEKTPELSGTKAGKGTEQIHSTGGQQTRLVYPSNHLLPAGVPPSQHGFLPHHQPPTHEHHRNPSSHAFPAYSQSTVHHRNPPVGDKIIGERPAPFRPVHSPPDTYHQVERPQHLVVRPVGRPHQNFLRNNFLRRLLQPIL
ncbi:putative per-hexamer repeat protein 5 [Amphibalanus amphitrite]|uniref:putative per-hexamer repeat protein 5 n=1 Tax=Amphibalanus amphitrite TaxID=1232801 RepID=UPI001C91B597|nr:putative per-hexamer repeat protein 5 [Amphibalanus amphitrite]